MGEKCTMADNKKYYYLKLKENFFDSDSMVLLESMPDGILYSNILMKMYLKSLRNDGYLVLNNAIPYNAQMIATVTRHQIGTVEKALEIFKQLGLIDVLDSGAIYMSDIQLFVGKSSTEADRKRESRMKIKQAEQLAIGQMSAKRSREKEIEKEIENNICASQDDERVQSNKNEQEIVLQNRQSQLDEQKDNFEKIYAIYPKKRGKQRAFGIYRQWLKGRVIQGERIKLTNKEMYVAVRNYVRQQEQEQPDQKYWKNFDTLMGATLLDYVDKGEINE